MPRLIVINDSISRETEELELNAGELLARELMRLFPGGIEGEWKLYVREITPRMELGAEEISDMPVHEGDVFVLVRRPGSEAYFIGFVVNLLISTFLTMVAKFFEPTPRRKSLTPMDQREAGTNQLVGQQNVLRPGARVPEILGRVRCYPDMLCAPVEEWAKRRQTIRQLFVVGMGSYDVTEVRLGETLQSNISGMTWIAYQPGELVPQFPAVRRAPEVNGISLMTEDEAIISATNATFNAAAKTMTLNALLSIPNNYPVFITGTNFNDGLFWVTGVPPTGSAAPFVYTLVGPVVNESGANAVVAVGEPRTTITRYTNYGNQSGDLINDPSPYQATAMQGIPDVEVGDVIEVRRGATIYRGTVSFVMNATDIGNPWLNTHYGLHDVYGAAIVFTDGYNEPTQYTIYDEGGGGSGGGGSSGSDFAGWTDWHTAPFEDPQEVWLDFAFPQGLAHYQNGTRNPMTVGIGVEFRRVGTTTTALRFFSHTEATNGYLQWTERMLVSTLDLPGTQAIEVRVQRGTQLYVDNNEHQYIQETVWKGLSAMLMMPARTYPDVTVILMTLSNSRSAVDMGATSFNAVVTRRLPHWTGSAWTAAAGTERWSDNFIARCKASDGASLPDSLIDLAGITALQTQLEALGDGGAHGKIALAIDQQQDIDAELAQIADVARAQVYRVGQKLFVVRDQPNPNAIALFNGRAKAAEAEIVSVRLRSSDEYDAVAIHWLDEASGWKLREYIFVDPSRPLDYIPTNVMRVAVQCANWPQAYRRAVFEWNKLCFRREQIGVNVTEDGRICRPGDVVNITDDLAHLAIAAGEVLDVSANVLTLDKDVAFTGSSHTLLVRDVEGQHVDSIPVVAVAGSSNKVQLSRAPNPSVTIKGRDEALGTLYAFYDDAAAIVRPWFLTSVEVEGPYVKLTGSNYTPRVYEGDSGTLPDVPPLEAATTRRTGT